MFAFFAVGLACLMLNAFMPLVLCFEDVGGRYLLHCSWLCLMFMLSISFFFLFFIYCNFVVFPILRLACIKLLSHRPPSRLCPKSLTSKCLEWKKTKNATRISNKYWQKKYISIRSGVLLGRQRIQLRVEDFYCFSVFQGSTDWYWHSFPGANDLRSKTSLPDMA